MLFLFVAKDMVLVALIHLSFEDILLKMKQLAPRLVKDCYSCNRLVYRAFVFPVCALSWQVYEIHAVAEQRFITEQPASL